MRIGINGFGRIGRTLARILVLKHPGSLVQINDLGNINTMAHLFKYDSVHGVFPGEIKVDGNDLIVNGNRIAFLSQKDPQMIPWSSLDLVYEATGIFKAHTEINQHRKSGEVHKVIVTAPCSDPKIPMVVMGINEGIIQDKDVIISNASCTTNNAAPMIQLIDELCGITQGYITTVHSYTGDQKLHDAPHPDLRRARAAAQSIVPTSTGAAKAISSIFPHLNGKMGGCGIRVPVPDGSLTDLTCVVEKPIDAELINAHFKKASQGSLSGILGYTEDPIVSIDIVGNSLSCLFDAQLTSVLGNMVKVVGWYDNEAGYSNRLVDLGLYVLNQFK